MTQTASLKSPSTAVDTAPVYTPLHHPKSSQNTRRFQSHSPEAAASPSTDHRIVCGILPHAGERRQQGTRRPYCLFPLTFVLEPVWRACRFASSGLHACIILRSPYYCMSRYLACVVCRKLRDEQDTVCRLHCGTSNPRDLVIRRITCFSTSTGIVHGARQILSGSSLHKDPHRCRFQTETAATDPSLLFYTLGELWIRLDRLLSLVWLPSKSSLRV